MVLGAQGTLESPDEPEPVSADDSGPFVVQEGVILGPGVGDEGRGDRDSEAVSGDADKEDIAPQSGLEDFSQPIIQDLNDCCGPPSPPIVLEPVDDDPAILDGQQLDPSTETTQTAQEDHPEPSQASDQHTGPLPAPQLDSGTLEEEFSANQPRTSLHDEGLPGQTIFDHAGPDGAQQSRPSSPGFIENSQVRASVEPPPSLIESRPSDSLLVATSPEQTLQDSQQVDQLIVASSNAEQPSVEERSDEPPSLGSPIFAPSMVDQRNAALGIDAASSEAALHSQQVDVGGDKLAQLPQEQEHLRNLESSTLDQAVPESGLPVCEKALDISRSSEELQSDNSGPSSDQLDSVEIQQVIDSVDSGQANDFKDGQIGLTLGQGSQDEIVYHTKLPESSLATEPQFSSQSASISPDLPLGQAGDDMAALPPSPSTPSTVHRGNGKELTMTPPADVPSDTVDAQDILHQNDDAQTTDEMSGSSAIDIPDGLGRHLLGSSVPEGSSQNELDIPGASLESSDVLPLDEQPSAVTAPLESGDAQVQGGSEGTHQGENDGTNDALVVSPRASLEGLPSGTVEQAPSIGDLPQPQLDTVVNGEVDSDVKDAQGAGDAGEISRPGSSAQQLESQAPTTDLERSQGQDEDSLRSQEMGDAGDLGDSLQPIGDLETSILDQETVLPSQEQDQDISGSVEASTRPGTPSVEPVDQSVGDIEAVSSGHNSGQATPKQLPISSEAGASSHVLEGQVSPSSPTGQPDDHFELSKEPDSVGDQDGPRQDNNTGSLQPLAGSDIESHEDGSCQGQIILEEPGTDGHGFKEDSSFQEVDTHDAVSEDVDRPSQMPLESCSDPTISEINGKRSTESLSHQPAQQISEDGGDMKNVGVAAAAAVAAGIAVHEFVTSRDDVGGDSLAVSASMDDIQRPRTADKATGTLEESAPDLNDLEVRSISSVAPDSPEEVSSQQPLSESFTIVDPPSSDQQQTIPDSSEKPVLLSRVDSSTQTDELWRPKSPLPRGSTPGIVLPDPNDEEVMGRSRARSARRMSKQSVHQAEEVVAAAVIIRAAADTLGETSDRMAVHVKDLKQHGDTTAPSNLQVDGRGTRVADTSIPYYFIANPNTGKESSQADDKLPRSPRTREHRASHSSRSSRPSTREDGTTRSSHHRHSHRHRADGERESEQVPHTPPRHQDTGESAHGSHSSRSRRERTPQEQAEHERRKEERRLAREKDKAKTDSPVAEPKGKEVEAPPSADRSHRSSRRHSSTRHSVASPSNTARTEASTAAPSKKFFDVKNGQSVMGSTFGGPLTADTASTSTKDKDKDTVSSSRRSKEVTRPPPVELKRSSTTRSSKGVRRSLDQSNAKLQKAREQESTKAARDSQPRREDSSSPAPADAKKAKDDDKHRKSRLEKREKEDKDEKKKSSGGLKGMFKRLFSS